MIAPKRIVALSLVVLLAAAAGAVFYVLSHRAAAAPVAADNPAQVLEKVMKEWRDLEQRHAEEMVKLRLEAAELEDQLDMREQELRVVRVDLSVIRKRIESLMTRLAQPKVPQQLQAEEKELSAKEKKIHADVRQLRQKLFLAEEKMWQLAREQAFERDRVRPQPNAADEKHGLERGTPIERRLQKAERELERLRLKAANDARDAKDGKDDRKGKREKAR